MDLQAAKSDLLIRKQEMQSRLERTHKHIYQKEEPVSANFNEQVKETENDQLVIALEAEGIEELALIDKALQRIDDDSYGSCVRCGESISEQRLQAISYADVCIRCAS